MNIADFQHFHGLAENPFRGEEARSDAVFSRMRGKAVVDDAQPAVVGAFAPGLYHAEFEKILGDLRRPASAVVFGEKGAGKTAIRIQLSEHVQQFNAANPAARIFLLAYDDLNGVLARIDERVPGKGVLDRLQKIRLVDHIDALLHRIVPFMVDEMLGVTQNAEQIDLGHDASRPTKRLDPPLRRDMLILQALYDRPEHADLRTRDLRRRLKVRLPVGQWIAGAITYFAPFLLAALAVYEYFFAPPELQADWAKLTILGLLTLYLLFVAKIYVFDRLLNLNSAVKIRKQLRVVSRGDVSFARSLRQLEPRIRNGDTLPLNDSDHVRYACLDRFRRVLRAFGYSSIMLVVDRVDEPTLVSGDPDRMKALVWPMLNNKFLQQEGIGVKLLLPVELRHALYKESSAFFQEARLDKQCLIERLSWTGQTLYELCDARIAACQFPNAKRTHLIDLFAEEVTRQDLLEALEAMHQPRDAFKFLYRCINEHCAGASRERSEFRISRDVLHVVLRQESERLQQLYRGIRPG